MLALTFVLYQNFIKKLLVYPLIFSLSLYVVSFFIVAGAQPDISSLLCVIASIGGFALFWKSLSHFQKARSRFFLSFIWFFGVEAVHLSWFAADEYVGNFIYLFLFLALSVLGTVFALFSLWITGLKTLTLKRILAITGLWTLLEWGRLFVLSGFSWDPLGLLMTATPEQMQLASVGGIYGLTFWTFLTNLLAYQVVRFPFTFLRLALWVIVAITPFILGKAHLLYHDHQKNKKKDPNLSIAIVQTSLYPEDKMNLNPNYEAYSPLDQWARILHLLKDHKNKNLDLILLPEGTVPYGTDVLIYPFNWVSYLYEKILGVNLEYNSHEDLVSNSYWTQSLANVFQADVIVGLDDFEGQHTHNAAFAFHPNDPESREKYVKRVLVPMGEYIPFEWCKKILIKYGIQDSFSPGKQAIVFQGKKVPIGACICYEETFGHLMRENRQKGARLLANITNDAWYPRSRLSVIHYMHGRVRAVEQGIPLVRSCNTGVSCGIDSLGRTVGSLDYETKKSSAPAQTLYLQLSSYSYPTLYAAIGDYFIVLFSFFCVLLSFIPQTTKAHSFGRELNRKQV